MADFPFATEVYVVAVAPKEGESGDTQFWAAAVPRHEAVVAVKKKVPLSRSVRLTDQRISSEYVKKLVLMRGDVCELKEVD